MLGIEVGAMEGRFMSVRVAHIYGRKFVVALLMYWSKLYGF